MTGALAAALFALSACVTEDGAFVPPAFPQSWQDAIPVSARTDGKEPSVLDGWWTFLGDPVLNDLVDMALKDNPDSILAVERVREARTAQRSMMETGSDDTDFYEPGFDASYEAGVLGKGEAVPEETHDHARLSLIAEIVRSYAEYCLIRKQATVAEERTKSGKKVLDLVREQKLYGAATDQDVAQAEARLDDIRAGGADFLRRSDNARLRLVMLTGATPEAVFNLVMNSDSSLKTDVTPILAAPAAILMHRPDIQAAQADFIAKTAYERFVTEDLFPSVSLSDLYGIQDGAFFDSVSGWSVTPGAAVAKVDFTRMESRVDEAQAQEEQAYQDFKLAVLQAVMDVESALVDYTRGLGMISEKKAGLDVARETLDLAKAQYGDGKIPFSDVLTAQQVVDSAEADIIKDSSDQTVLLIGLYKSLGVY